MIQYALLAMQAAGMVTDWLGTQDQIYMSKLGNKITQAGITANIALTQAQYEDQTEQSLEQLRQAIGTQIATNAARGNAAGGGTNAAQFNRLYETSNDDQRARQLNLNSKIAGLKSEGFMSNLRQDAYEAQIRKDFFKRTMNNLPASSLENIGSSFGMTPA